MNVEIGTEPPQFLFWEYVFRIFGFVSSWHCAPVPISQLLTQDRPRRLPATSVTYWLECQLRSPLPCTAVSLEETIAEMSCQRPESSPLRKSRSRGHRWMRMEWAITAGSSKSFPRLNSASRQSVPPTMHLTLSSIRPLSRTVANSSAVWLALLGGWSTWKPGAARKALHNFHITL